MFVLEVEKLVLENTAEIVQIARSPCGRYLAIITRTTLLIKSLFTKDLKLLSNFTRDGDSMDHIGFNHWIQWINSTCIAVGTQAGNIFIFNLEDGKIVQHNSFNFPSIITAYTTAYSALVVASSGPVITFISPDGDIISRISFNKSVPTIVRHIDFQDNLAAFTFSDGTVSLSSFKQSDIINKTPLAVNLLPMTDITSTQLCRNYIALQTFTGIVYKLPINTEKPEIVIVSESAALFNWVRDSSNIISLSAEGILSIYSSRTTKISKTQLNFGLKKDENTNLYPNFITSEVDGFGLKMFCATVDQCYQITFAAADSKLPNNIFHSPTEIIDVISGKRIAVDNEMIENNYPLQHVAFSDNGMIMFAGRRNFAMLDVKTNQWHFTDLDMLMCRALWFQNGFFISIVFDSSDPQYKVVVFSPISRKLVDLAILSGVFLNIDYKADRFFVYMQKSGYVFSIEPPTKMVKDRLKLIREYKIDDDKQIDGGTLCSDLESVCLIMSSDKSLVQFPSKEIISNEVTTVFASPNSSLLFILAHGAQFVRSYNSMIRLEQPFLFVEGLYGYSCPREYDIVSFKLKKTPFMHTIMNHWLSMPERVKDIILGIKDCEGIIESVTKTILFAVNHNKFNEIRKALELIPQIKDHFLVIALFNVESDHQDFIKSLLPPKEELIKKFPDLKNEINMIY